jgi:hypothetical protein
MSAGDIEEGMATSQARSVRHDCAGSGRQLSQRDSLGNPRWRPDRQDDFESTFILRERIEQRTRGLAGRAESSLRQQLVRSASFRPKLFDEVVPIRHERVHRDGGVRPPALDDLLRELGEYRLCATAFLR